MLGLLSGQIHLFPYEPEWELLFLKERELLQAELGEDILGIQHIGSTAIPGMLAKPILDIGIAVRNFEAATRYIDPMKKLGYAYKGENGIARRHYFVKGEPRTHHIHMLELKSEEWQHHLLFRDYLIAHPEIAQKYAKLKQELATQLANNREAYQAGKGSFINAVLNKAKKGHSNAAEGNLIK